MDDGPLTLLGEVLREPAADAVKSGARRRRPHSPDQRRTWRSRKLPGPDERARARGAPASAAGSPTSASTRSSTGGPTLALVRLEERREHVGDDVAVEVLHHVERLAERVLLAERDDPRDADAELRERELQAGLARMSCAEGGSGGRGGRRSTSRAPSRSTRKVTFELPAPIRPTRSGPRPSPLLVEEALDVLEHEQRRDGSAAASAAVATTSTAITTIFVTAVGSECTGLCRLERD